MEFRLNKIELEQRQKINDRTVEGRVHRKNEIAISNDSSDNNRGGHHNSFQEQLKKSKKHIKKFSIEAVKVSDVKVEGFMEKKEAVQENNYKGVFLDIRK